MIYPKIFSDVAYTFGLPSHTGHSYWWKMNEEEDSIILEFGLPGIKEDEIEIKYKSENGSIRLFVKDKAEKEVLLSRQVDPDKIEASLELGILSIKAPILNTDRIIEIK